MPATYTLIASNTLSSSAASVTFSAIPATYTDLVLRWSSRTDNASVVDVVLLEFNASGGTAYSTRRIIGTGSAAASTGLAMPLLHFYRKLMVQMPRQILLEAQNCIFLLIQSVKINQYHLLVVWKIMQPPHI